MKIIFFTLLSTFLFCTSCKDKEKTDLVKDVNAFLNNNSSAVAYGSIHLGDIISKSDIVALPGFGELIAEQLMQVNAGLAVKERFYFVLDGPFDRDGLPVHTYAFFAVNNKDSLIDLFATMGYFFEEKNGLHVAEDMSSAIAFNDKLAVLVNTTFDEDAAALVKHVFDKVKAGGENPQISKNLLRSGDIVFSSYLENLYSTSNTDLNKLPVKQQEEIKRLAHDSHFSTAIHFNQGEIRIENFTDFNDELAELMFFKENTSFHPADKVGPGKPAVAFSMEMDIVKLENLLRKFYPDATKEMYKAMGTTGLLLKALGGEGLNQLIDGRLAFAFTSLPEDFDGGNIPEVSLFMGVGKSSSKVVDLLLDFMDDGMLEEVREGVFQLGDARAYLSKDELKLHSNAVNYEESELGKNLELPEAVKDFGSKPFSLYIDLKMIHEAGIDGGSKELKTILALTDYLFMEADNSETVLVIKLKDDSKNVLKAVIDALRSQLEEAMNRGMMM